MSKWEGYIAVSVFVLLLLAAAPAATAQDPDDPAEPPAEPEPAPAVIEQPELQTPKRNFSLYVGVGGGVFSGDSLNTSIVTDATRVSSGELEFDEMERGMAAIGWQLPEGKGDFRMVFNGYKETDYSSSIAGAAIQLAGDLQLSPSCDGNVEISDPQRFTKSPANRCLYNWWFIDIENGQLNVRRSPPEWLSSSPGQGDDLNGNGEADPFEVRSLAPDITITQPITDDLQNRIQTVDLMYGREFGGRRYSSRWWGGLRYFEYEGQLLAGAWLASGSGGPGSGFTDGTFLRLLNLAQETSGAGPVGVWEVDFNFFNKGVVLYARGESAFTFNSVEVDSGRFFTLVGGTNTIVGDARLRESRDKSSWQNKAGAGVRIRLRNGLEFELGYSIQGFLDIALMPSEIAIPESVPQAQEGVSALYLTQDQRLDGWHAGVGFQF